MDLIKTVNLKWLWLCILVQVITAYGVNAPTYYESSDSYYKARYQQQKSQSSGSGYQYEPSAVTTTTTPYPPIRGRPTHHPNSYYSRLSSSDYSSNRASKSNSKFAGYGNEEARRYHRRRRPNRLRPSDASYDPCVGRSSRPQGKFFLGTNQYDIYSDSIGLNSQYYRPRPRPPPIDYDYDCDTAYDDVDRPSRPRPDANTFYNLFRPGGIFYQGDPVSGTGADIPLSPNYNRPPPQFDEGDGGSTGLGGSGLGGSGLGGSGIGGSGLGGSGIGGSGIGGGAGGGGGGFGGGGGSFGPQPLAPGPFQIIGGFSSYLNTVIQTIVGNRLG